MECENKIDIFFFLLLIPPSTAFQPIYDVGFCSTSLMGLLRTLSFLFFSFFLINLGSYCSSVRVNQKSYLMRQTPTFFVVCLQAKIAHRLCKSPIANRTSTFQKYPSTFQNTRNAVTVVRDITYCETVNLRPVNVTQIPG